MALLVADGGLRVLVCAGLAEAVPPLSSRAGAVLLEAAGIAVVSPRVGAVVLVVGLPEAVVPALSTRARPVALEDVGLPGPAPPLLLREIAPAASVVAVVVVVVIRVAAVVSSIVVSWVVLVACAVVRLLPLVPEAPFGGGITPPVAVVALVPEELAIVVIGPPGPKLEGPGVA